MLTHLDPKILRLSKQLKRIEDRGHHGVRLYFEDGTTEAADLVVGADGIRSVSPMNLIIFQRTFFETTNQGKNQIVRDCAWPEYNIRFTGTTIWRALLRRSELEALDPRFDTTAWWHLPTSHVYFSPVGDGFSEIAARELQDPKIHAGSKSSWGVPVSNEYVESHFTVSRNSQ